ncbi:MAG TPA: GNAT family N-acetyltransferase [Longimicrobiaceae bacterium]|nr:GNAT family N-acetyltransferase [Longimicrobiaceae bacterium]
MTEPAIGAADGASPAAHAEAERSRARLARPEPVVLTGRTVRLEPLAPEHEAALTEAGRSPEIWRYTLSPMGAELMQPYLAKALADRDAGTALPFAVCHLGDGRLIGCTRYLDISPEHRSLEIGFTWYAPEYWRTAVNTECKHLLLRHAFEVLGCVRVEFRANAQNLRSRTAIARLGAVEEGTLRSEWLRPDGSRRDVTYFSILDHEWPAVQARLERMLERTPEDGG